jgi:hypothetical protein
MKVKIITIGAILGLVGFLVWQSYAQSNPTNNPATPAEPSDRVVTIEIGADATYGSLLEQAGVGTATSTAIFTAAQAVYDLSNIRLGRTIDLVYDHETDQLKQLIYQIDTEEKLYVGKITTTTASTTKTLWQAERKPIEYEVRIKTAGGTVESSIRPPWIMGLTNGRLLI